MSIDTNQEQIVFYRENNFWYFKAEDNGEKLQIRAGTGFTNWNSDAFAFYQNGNLKIPATCRSNGLYNTSTLHQGGAATFLSSITSNCLENQFQIHNVNNFWYLSAAAYSTQSENNKLTLWPGYSINNFQDKPFDFIKMVILKFLEYYTQIMEYFHMDTQMMVQCIKLDLQILFEILPVTIV